MQRSSIVMRCHLRSVCLSSCVLWPNSWTDQDETWHAGRPRPWPHCVRWEPSSPFPKGAQFPPPILAHPQFSLHICCGQMAAWIKMSLGMEQGPGASPPQKGGGGPKFWAPAYCGQTAAWIRMPRGMQIGLSPSDIVLDGDPCHTNPNRTH